ncbi:hypothetical protein NL374_27265, partial [Klebsiella pneumoniae]|nr:hypothetical protein [Klebsiella pneumoniae]
MLQHVLSALQALPELTAASVSGALSDGFAACDKAIGDAQIQFSGCTVVAGLIVSLSDGQVRLSLR